MMDPISLFAFFFRYLYKDIPRVIGIAGLLIAVVWAIAKYADVSAIEFMSLRPSPTALFTTATVLMALGFGAAWQGFAAYRDGWPLRWTWGSFVWASYDEAKGAARVELFNGLVENVSDNPVQLDELAIVSGQTGQPIEVHLNDRYGKYLPASQFYPLPPHSGSVDFRASFNAEAEALPEDKYWSQIGPILFVAKYAGREYRKQFSREEIMAQINRVKPKPDLPYPAVRTTK